ncbi:hypothetical protein QJS04_geneDACA023929 [Acorus gramineus]|uniref:Uncharacterized protein n=1 Tax=Acorus gramineus TaxID=55184 RepID=A0AAV9BD14_ACOGR|nr:hypothetical protein QJS04_geneDACA023929 [Acorus gramineus]
MRALQHDSCTGWYKVHNSYVMVADQLAREARYRRWSWTQIDILASKMNNGSRPSTPSLTRFAHIEIPVHTLGFEKKGEPAEDAFAGRLRGPPQRPRSSELGSLRWPS